MRRFSGWAELVCGSTLSAAAVLICVAVSFGCATTPEPSESFPVAQDPVLLLKPGDVLQVKFLYWPELNEEGQTIRPDGRISLQLVGEVVAEGKEPEVLRQELLGLYKDKLLQPEISVVVRSLDSHRVYVGGEVLAPGLVPVNGRLTALEAIMQAGGPRKESSKLSTVVIVRQQDGQQYATTLDLRNALESPQSSSFELAPRDIVYVPRTAIDRVDQWVDKYINQIIPRSVHANFTFTKDLDSGNNSDNGARAAQLLSNVNSNAIGTLGDLSSVTQ
ncbi:MAG: polysaccharide export protein [Candidatus Hydrogenedentes bacterium]|nr:polysaccharide export protein [Candidatus Hydrogenedentota bacterium]